MAAILPWLKDTLEEALVDYLDRTGTTLQCRSSKYNYAFDNSNLRIWPFGHGGYQLTVIEVRVFYTPWLHPPDHFLIGVPTFGLLPRHVV